MPLFDNKDADQCLCFRYLNSVIPLLSKPLGIFCSCAAWFVLDPVQNPEDRFSHDKAQIIQMLHENMDLNG